MRKNKILKLMFVLFAFVMSFTLSFVGEKLLNAHGETAACNGNHSGGEWKALKKALLEGDGEFAGNSNLATHEITAGNWYLTEDLVLSKPISFAVSQAANGDITSKLCLNGFTITRPGTNSTVIETINIYQSSNMSTHLHICDCNTSKVTKGFMTANNVWYKGTTKQNDTDVSYNLKGGAIIATGRAIYSYNKNLEISGGNFVGCETPQEDFIDFSSGSLKLTGGNFVGNKVSRLIDSESLNSFLITDGVTFEKNTATDAMIYASGSGSSPFQITGGTFKNIVAENSIFQLYRAQVEISGGTFENNKVNNYNKYCLFFLCGDSAVFNITGGTFTNNTAYNGSIFYCDSGTVNIKGGTFTNNTGNKGGFAFIRKATVNLTGGIIKNNTASFGGAFYLSDNTGTLNIENYTLSENTASKQGGAIYVKEGNYTINLGGKVVLDNTGGNIYLNEACKIQVMENNPLLAGSQIGISYNPSIGIKIVALANAAANDMQYIINEMSTGYDMKQEGSEVIIYKQLYLTYDPNGGNGEQIVVGPSDGTVELQSCSYTHPSLFQFMGWNTKADGTGVMYSVGNQFTFTKDTTLYAIWKLGIENVEVTSDDYLIYPGMLAIEIDKNLLSVDAESNYELKINEDNLVYTLMVYNETTSTWEEFNGEVFELNKQYGYKVTVLAKEGYGFAANTQFGDNLTVYKFDNAFELEVIFDLGICEYIPINEVNVTFKDSVINSFIAGKVFTSEELMGLISSGLLNIPADVKFVEATEFVIATMEDDSLEEIDYSKPLDVNVKYYLLAVITTGENEFSQYAFAKGVTTSNEGYSINVDQDNNYSLVAQVIYELGELDPIPLEESDVTVTTEKITYNGLEQNFPITVVRGTEELILGTHYTVTNGCKKDVGTYTVTITFTGIYSGSHQILCEIKKAELTVTVNDENIIYGDAKPNYSVTFTGFANNETESVLGGELEFSSEYAQFSNIGEYVVSASGYTSNNYNIIYINGNVTVSPKEVGLTWDNLTLTYNAKEQAPTVTATGLVNNDECIVVVTGGKTDVGTFTATAASLTNSNYKLPTTVTAQYEIMAKSISNATVELENSLVYTGLELTQNIKSVTVDGLVLSATEYAVSNNKQTAAGEYELTITANGNFTGSLVVDYVIAKAQVEVNVETTSFVYNGNAHVVLVATNLYTVTGETNTNVGSYEAKLTLIDDDNYKWKAPFNGTIAWEITKATYDMSGITFADVTVTYDGTEHKALIAGTLPAGVEVTYENNAGTNVGTYNAVAKFTGNANYNAIADMTAIITINKATYNMSGITFADVTVTYDGTEHKALIAGTLPAGVTVTYENNAGTNAGTYNAVAKFTYDAANYNVIENINAVLTINKEKVALPEATTSFTYNGTAHTAVDAHDLYIVTEGSATNAGTYEAVITLKDTDNYEWAESFNGKIAWSIAKATHDMSGVTFNSSTVVYNGNEHKIEITGTLPEGVTVSYTNNKGTNAGVYNAVAKFSYDTANYNTIADMKAVLTINIDTLDTTDQIKDETGKPMVEVSSEEGIAPGTKLDVNVEEEIKTDKSIREKLGLEKNERVAATYDINLSVDGNNVEPNGTMTVKLLIPSELRGKEFSIRNVKNGTETEEVEFTIDGDYAIVKTDEALEFAIVYETGSLLWLIILLAVFVTAEVGALVFLLNKKKTFNTMKLAAYPVFAFGMFLPVVHLVLAIILIVAFIALTTVDGILAYGMYGDKIKSFFKKDNVNQKTIVTQEVKEETLEDEEVDNEAEEYLTKENVRIVRSFTARLIQTTDEVKDYYDIIKNELQSYKKIKSRISFKHETFKINKETVARLVFRGKVLCLYLALNPADYENSKYKVEDKSKVSSNNIPTMYRISDSEKAEYSKDLIRDLMMKFNVEQTDINFASYSSNYPYEDTEELIEKGLIRKTVKTN